MANCSCHLLVRLRMNGAIHPGPPCAYMADIGISLPLHCKGDKGSGINFDTMYRRLGFWTGILGMVLHWDHCCIFHCINTCAMFSGLFCNALLCVNSILAFQCYGQTVVSKYFHELAEKQNVLRFAFVSQNVFSYAKKIVSFSNAYI